MGNLTLAIEDDLLRRARVRAAEQGTSVNAVVREYLEDYAGRERGRAAMGKFLEIAARSGAGSGERGRRWTREDLYDRESLRRH